MRGDDAVVYPAQGAVPVHRLVLEHIYARVGELAAYQRVRHRLLVHDSAAGCVDEDRAILHLGYTLGVYHTV